LFGFAGLLLAVPVAAMFGVIVRYFFDQYKSTNFYTDPEDN
ncbi:MAG: putative PurR-regulated permease PerM, partial [Paracoccaceae bacterium]